MEHGQADAEQGGAMEPLGQSAVQLLLFEIEQGRSTVQKDQNRSRTHTVGLYDIAPRFVFYPSGPTSELVERSERSDKPVEREFEFRGRALKLTLKPAFLKRKIKAEEGEGEEWVNVFPSEREQVVEAVIRRLATDRGRLSVDDRNRVLMRFSIYEVQKELERVNRTLSGREIKEALTILSQSVVEIRAKGKGGRVEFASTAFPTLVFRSQGDDATEAGLGNSETYLQFNVMVGEAIRALKFRLMSYGWMMRFRNPVSRWLFNVLTLEYESKGSDEVTVMHARAIVRDSGMNEWSRPRDTFRAVRDAVMALKAEGILESVEIEKVMSGRKLDNEIYTMIPSAKFLHEVEAATLLTERNEADFGRVAASPAAESGFIPVAQLAAVELRRRRARGAALPPPADRTE